MSSYIVPPKEAALSVKYEKEIMSYFASVKDRLGFDFFGMAERSPYGEMYVSSNTSLVNLFYESGLYSIDPAITRASLGFTKNTVTYNTSINKDHQRILDIKRERCKQVGNFTIPVLIGETEIYFCISSYKSTDILYNLDKNKRKELIEVGLGFRKIIYNAIGNTGFTQPAHIREMFTYHINDGFAFMGHETLTFAGLKSKNFEIARFPYMVKELYRIISGNYSGFTDNFFFAFEEKLAGGQVQRLIIIESFLGKNHNLFEVRPRSTE